MLPFTLSQNVSSTLPKLCFPLLIFSQVHLLQPSGLEELVGRLCRLLEDAKQSAEALSINHVRELSNIDKTLDGLGLSGRT